MFGQVGLRLVSLVTLVVAGPVSDDVRKVRRDASDSDSVITLPPLRRSNYYTGERQFETLSEGRAYPTSQSGEHCVVWGDWTFTGRKFNSNDEAVEHFKHVKRTELAVVHMHNSREVSRFMSKRLVSVKWEKMKEWCAKHSGDDVGSAQEDEETPSSRKVEMRVGRNGAISDATDGERYTFEKPRVPDPSQTRHRHHSSHQPEDDETPIPEPSQTRHQHHASHQPSEDEEVSFPEPSHTRHRHQSSYPLEDEKPRFPEPSHTRHRHQSSYPLEDEKPPVPEPSQTRHRHHSLQESESTHFSASAPRPAQRSRFSPVTSSLTSEGDHTASTLSGKVSLLEQEVEQLNSKALELFNSVGVNSNNFGPASGLEHGPGGKQVGKLKIRLVALEEFTASVQAKTNALETEFFGSTTADKPANVRKDSGSSFKGKIEAVSMKIEELKGKISALDSSPLLGEVAKLEQKAASLGNKAKSIFSVIGVESGTAPTAKLAESSVLKERLNSLEQYADEMQRNAASLEYDILGNSWNLPASGDSLKGGCIKDHAGSLGNKLTDLESRLSTLASAPIVTDVSKMEGALTSLAQRASALSKNVGINGKLSENEFTAPKTATLRARITSLESELEKMQSATASLEDELAGSVGTMPAHSQKDTLKSKANILELQVENLNGRISALEQQV